MDRRALLQLAGWSFLAGRLEAATTIVVLRTSRGQIEVEVDVARAPITAANFLRYVDGGYYAGGRFHRTMRLDNQPGKNVLIEVVQAGVNPMPARPGFPRIPLERTKDTGLRHVDGALSMARDGPDSATSDFFICIGDLDGNRHRALLDAVHDLDLAQRCGDRRSRARAYSRCPR